MEAVRKNYFCLEMVFKEVGKTIGLGFQIGGLSKEMELGIGIKTNPRPIWNGMERRLKPIWQVQLILCISTPLVGPSVAQDRHALTKTKMVQLGASIMCGPVMCLPKRPGP
jgi:hypothetical protein